MYQKHNKEGSVQRLSDMAVIPNNPQNRDWRKYKAWLAEGNKLIPMARKKALVVDENEEKIKAELRRMAIANLGEQLPKDYN